MNFIDLVYLPIFGVLIFMTVLWLVMYLRDKAKVLNDPEPTRFPSVTFLVPAYNEEEHISECIESLLDQDYPEGKLEVIAINDGSTDNTLQELEKYQDEITIIDKENTGKANSINQGLEKVDTELVGCMDGDSVASRQMVKKMVPYFEKEDVKGVTPAMKVRNAENIFQKVIWAEFTYQVFLRKMFSLFGSQWVMPGPGSLYETEYLKELGGWDEDTLTEDMEIAFRMFKDGARIANSTNAYVDTITPPTFRGLLNQRTRWYRGYLNNFLRYKEFFMNPRYGNLGVFMLPMNMAFMAILAFMFVHMGFRILNSAYALVESYMALGVIPFSLSFSVQSLSLFHLFYGTLTFLGVTVFLLSLKTAEEDLKLWERKTHYISFLGFYTVLFTVFWGSALYEEIKGGPGNW